MNFAIRALRQNKISTAAEILPRPGCWLRRAVYHLYLWSLLKPFCWLIGAWVWWWKLVLRPVLAQQITGAQLKHRTHQNQDQVHVKHYPHQSIPWAFGHLKLPVNHQWKWGAQVDWRIISLVYLQRSQSTYSVFFLIKTCYRSPLHPEISKIYPFMNRSGPRSTSQWWQWK